MIGPNDGLLPPNDNGFSRRQGQKRFLYAKNNGTYAGQPSIEAAALCEVIDRLFRRNVHPDLPQ